MLLENCLIIQTLATAAMTGVIWMVQTTIYPLLGTLKGATFENFHHRYMKQVTLVIAPLMFLEASTCAACLYLGDWKEFVLPTLLLAVVWFSTAFIQVPQHQKLTPRKVRALVRSNWIRTTAWTLRLITLAPITWT